MATVYAKPGWRTGAQLGAMTRAPGPNVRRKG